MFQKVPLFYKYILSYSVLLIIPIVIVSVFSYQHFVSILKEEIMLDHERMLEQMRDTFDTKIKEMNRISYEISMNPELTPYHLEQNMYNAYSAKRLLNFTVANDFIQNVLLYFQDMKYIYSSTSTYSIPVFKEKVYNYQNWSDGQFIKDLHSFKYPVFRPSEDVISPYLSNNRAVTYIVPLPLNSGHSYGAVLFLIDEQKIKKLQERVIEKRVGNTLILNEKGEMITALYNKEYLQDPNFLQSLKSVTTGSKSIQVDHEEFILSTVKSKHTGWTYMTLMPEEHLMAKVNQVQYRAFIALIASLVLGTVIITYLMQVNYRPLKKVFSIANYQFGKAVESTNDILNALSQLHERNQSIESKWKDNEDAIRKYLLIELLHGQTVDPEAVYRRAEEVGLHFRNRRFFIMRMEMKHQQIDSIQLFTDRVWSDLEKGFALYEVKLADPKVQTFLGVTDNEDMKGALLHFHYLLYEHYNENITLGVGHVYEDMNSIGKSYIEASTALDYKLIKGRNQVIFYDEILVEHQLDYWYPKQEIETLHLFVNEGETTKTIELIKNIHQEVEKIKPPLHIIRCICYDIINEIIKSTHRKENRYLAEITYPDIEKLSNFETLQDFERLVNDICLRLNEANQSLNAEKREFDLRDRAIEYIRENYQDNQFSIVGMAECLCVSKASLMRNFKQHTGYTVNEYLSIYRIDHAKQLLIESDISLREVVKLIGYNDVSSFIRKFKAELKITPGEYRKLHEEKRGLEENKGIT